MPDDILLILLFGTMKLVALGLGAVLLVPLLRDERAERGGTREDDGGQDGGSDRRPPDAPPTRGPGDSLPLPDAAPARVRLREPQRLADLLPTPERRPEHAPEPVRLPVRD